MPLFETLPIVVDTVKQLVKLHWALDLADVLKQSQNHTFLAHGPAGDKFVVRVTPDPKGERLAHIESELKLLHFLDANKLPVSKALASNVNGSMVVCESQMVICAFTFAAGSPVVFQEWKWMLDEQMVVGLGKWIGQLHALTKRYARENPAEAAKFREWTQLHEGVLSGVNVSPDDSAVVNDPEAYGIIHGDVNPSNYHWVSDAGLPCVFDWDQVQRSWFLYDLSQPIWAVIALEGSGSPITGEKVPEANPTLFTEQLLRGYELVSGVSVDRARLNRMIDIRRELYRRFCSRALAELPPDSPMGKFCAFVVAWLGKEETAAPQKQGTSAFFNVNPTSQLAVMWSFHEIRQGSEFGEENDEEKKL